MPIPTAEKMIHFSGDSSEPLSSLICFFDSGTAKVNPNGGGGHAAPGSTSTLCLSPVHHTPLQKWEVEDAGGQGGRKGLFWRWGE